MKQNRFPISQQLNIRYNNFEDRLMLSASRIEHEPAAVLLTRRMTLLMIKQLLNRLTAMSDLDKTPQKYWQDVMQMGHETAMQAKREQDRAQKAQGDDASVPGDNQPDTGSGEGKTGQALYLATEMTLQTKGKQLMLALKGLPMPAAMTKPTRQEAILAIPLQQENIHQMIELLMTRATEANWNIPVQLPWRSDGKQPVGSSDGARLDN